MRRLGRDDGGSAIEAALLIAAMTLVLVPILYALGKTTTSAFEDHCDTVAETLERDGCQESGGSGGSGGNGGGEAGNTAEGAVRDFWSGQGGDPDDDVHCDGWPESPPPPGASVDCTVTGDSGTQTFTVTADESGSFNVS